MHYFVHECDPAELPLDILRALCTERPLSGHDVARNMSATRLESIQAVSARVDSKQAEQR
eukprot:4940074-Alexandrium_andersonii.AAC.1